MPTNPMYLEGCLPKPLPRKPKPHGYPTNFVEPNTRPNSPTAFFFYYSTCLGVSLAATLRKVPAIMNTFYQGVPAAFSPRAQCKPCPFSKDCRAQVESNIASQVTPALSTRTAVNPFNKDCSQTLTY